MTGGKNKRSHRRSKRRISVRAVRRDPIDVRKLSRALLALAEAETAARAAHEGERTGDVAEPGQEAPS